MFTSGIFIAAQLQNTEMLLPMLDRSTTGISGILETGLPRDYAGNADA